MLTELATKNNKRIDAKLINTVQQLSNNSQNNDNTVVINSSKSAFCEKHDSYELKRNGERDNKEYKTKCEEQRRESFDFCNDEGVRQRIEKEYKDANDICEQHDSYESKKDDERNTAEYNKKCEEQRQESFNFCNDEDVRQRLEKVDKVGNDFCEQHDSYELKRDGERNIKEYKKKCEEQCQESFAFSNAEDVRQQLKKEKKIAFCEKNDRYELKRDGERDNKEYKKKCEEQRRESFALCNDEGVRQRLAKEDKDANDFCENMIAMSRSWMVNVILKNIKRNVKSSIKRVLLLVMLRAYVND